MKFRLVKLRKNLGLSQAAFAEPLNLSRTAVANYEQGVRPVTDRTIADICRIYNVNEEWLRYGTGEMLRKGTSIDAELTSLIADLINSDDEWVKNCIVRFLKLSPQSRETFKMFLSDICGNDTGA